VARRHGAIDNLAFDKLALEVGGDEVDAADITIATSGEGE
jgi:hypothetical protein